MAPRKNLVGRTFHYLLVLEVIGSNKFRQTVYKCRCKCGTEKEIQGNCLTNGSVKSCGCLVREMLEDRNHRHGKAKRTAQKPEYRAYYNAKNRCDNPNTVGYEYYGGRGIQFLFTSFMQFYEEIGSRPDGHTLDRIDPDKDYEPGNVRWATRSQQSQNKRKVNPMSARIAELEAENEQLRKQLGSRKCTVSQSQWSEAPLFS